MMNIILYRVHWGHRLMEFLLIFPKMECIKQAQADQKLKKLFNTNEKVIAQTVLI